MSTLMWSLVGEDGCTVCPVAVAADDLQVDAEGIKRDVMADGIEG